MCTSYRMHARCAGRLPAALLTMALRTMQDDLPAAGLSHVRRSVRREFGAPLEEVFSQLDAVPLASASVAQVHAASLRTRCICTAHALRMHCTCTCTAHALHMHMHCTCTAHARAQVHAATLRASGQRVVLKLQHRGISALMARDMVAARRITSFVRRFAPSFGVLHTVLVAWEAEMVRALKLQYLAPPQYPHMPSPTLPSPCTPLHPLTPPPHTLTPPLTHPHTPSHTLTHLYTGSPPLAPL